MTNAEDRQKKKSNTYHRGPQRLKTKAKGRINTKIYNSRKVFLAETKKSQNHKLKEYTMYLGKSP